MNWWKWLLLVGLIGGILPVQAQKKVPVEVLKDTAAVSVLRRYTAALYDWQFEEARRHARWVGQRYPGHPVAPFTEAMVLFWEAAPMVPDDPTFSTFAGLLEKTSAMADERLKIAENDTEGVFFKLSARSILMRYEAQQGHTMKAVGEAKGLYQLLRKGMKLTDQFSDFYFTTGLYNYYREVYPDRHPVYKPFAVFFEAGDKELGLAQMEKATKEALFTRTEAYSYLIYLYLRYEQAPNKALLYAADLIRRYPRNLYYLQNITEAALLARQYEAAERTARLLRQERKSGYYHATGMAFEGMALWHRRQPEDAKQCFEKALAEAGTLGLYRSKLPKVYAHYGMSLYYTQKKMPKQAAEHLRQAKDTDDYGLLKRLMAK